MIRGDWDDLQDLLSKLADDFDALDSTKFGNVPQALDDMKRMADKATGLLDSLLKTKDAESGP